MCKWRDAEINRIEFFCIKHRCETAVAGWDSLFGSELRRLIGIGIGDRYEVDAGDLFERGDMDPGDEAAA